MMSGHSSLDPLAAQSEADAEAAGHSPTKMFKIMGNAVVEPV